jgi:hypothetical protein
MRYTSFYELDPLVFMKLIAIILRNSFYLYSIRLKMYWEDLGR